MIRVNKYEIAPQSLSITNKYNGDDVYAQLKSDQHSKCYLCERSLVNDFEVEHLKSKENFDELIQDWDNLFFVCSYCNGKKRHYFDDILNPLSVNIEDEICQEIDIRSKKGVFTSVAHNSTAEHDRTIELLNRIFNGRKKLRTTREESTFEYLLGVYNRFVKLVSDYATKPTSELESLIISELAIDKEILGIKYWLIKKNPYLESVFGQYLVWNKH